MYSNFLLTIIIATSLFTACKKDPVVTPPPPTNQEEVLTTIKLTFVDSSGTSPNVTAIFRDPDGDGGNAYTQWDTINLLQNKTYLTSILILNETASPIDTISNEILEEANDHLFIFTPTGANLNIQITDLDTNTPSLPLGLQSKWKTGPVSIGTTRVVLKHQPNVKNGTTELGTTDLDVLFQTKIN